jgi:hypothetical protein
MRKLAVGGAIVWAAVAFTEWALAIIAEQDRILDDGGNYEDTRWW